jgi:hypothetical protein
LPFLIRIRTTAGGYGKPYPYKPDDPTWLPLTAECKERFIGPDRLTTTELDALRL